MSEPTITYLGPASEADSGDIRMDRQWKLVPVEPTETMVINGFESEPDECFTDEEVWEQYKEMSGCQQAAFRAKLCWAAMLASAPAPPPADAGEVARLTAERDALQLRLNAADQRIDELTPPVSPDPVTWGAPKTVRQLIQQLQTLDQDLRPLSMLRVPGNVFEDGKERTRAVHLSISHERVDGQWLAPFKSECEKVLAFWCRMERPAPVFGFPVVIDPTLAPDEMQLVMPAARRTDEVEFKGMIETIGGEFAIMIDEANAHYGWTFKRHPDGMWVSGRKATDAEMQAARRHAQAAQFLTGVHLYSTPL